VTETDTALSILEGGAALSVAPRELALASLAKMEVAVPGQPLASPEGARRRRGRLRTAVLNVDESRVRAAVDEAALADAGITGLVARLAEGAVRLRGRAHVGGREVDFTARAFVRAASGRRARIVIDDVRTYGFLPIPAPLLGGAILSTSALGGWEPGQRAQAPRHWSTEVDALNHAVYETFAECGFRLPDISGARLGAVAVTPAGITLTWSTDAARASDAPEITSTGAPRPMAEADGLLARGDAQGALAAYRTAARGGEASIEAERRVLELLLANAETLAEAGAQAARLARLSDQFERVVTLAEAIVASETGNAARSAQAYTALATAADAAGEPDDAELARLAAAREWLRAHMPDDARPLVEAVLAAQPNHAGAKMLLAACEAAAPATPAKPVAAEEAPPPAVEAEAAPPPPPAAKEEAAPAPPPPSATQPVTALAVALAEAELAEAAERFDAAAKALRRALDLLPPKDETRAELARRLAALSDRLGDDEGTLSALRQYLDGAAAGPNVAPAWRRVVELHARRGDPQAAARALISSADDARTGSSDEERGAALTAAAEILRKRMGLPGDAVMLLERAIALAPRAVETLDALQTLAVESGSWERLADVLERKVDVLARGPVEQKALLVQLAEVYDRHLHRSDRARDTHERALQIDPRFRDSLAWLARDAWVRGDNANAATLYGRLAEVEAQAEDPGLSPELRAETRLRLGQLARRAGDDAAAEREVEQALALVPDHAAALDLLIELLEAQGRHADLADTLARRISTDLAPAARAELVRRRAHALERAGRVNDAAALWRALVEVDPVALPALRRLAEGARAADDAATLFAVLAALGEALEATGDVVGAEQIVSARQQLAGDADPVVSGALAADRARLILAQADRANDALTVLRGVPVAALPPDGLALLADLAEHLEVYAEALPALEELAARLRDAGQGDAEATRDLEARAAALAERLRPATVDELEAALGSDPTNGAAAEGLAIAYAQIEDSAERATALSGLLKRALGLSPDRRKAIYAVLGETAEASGDLEGAEQAYWRAATIEAEPALRANFLVSHARVLLARGEVQTAMSELEEAIQRVPHHAGALALLADLTYRTQDWTRARQLYAELEVAPDAAVAIARETLVHRRAVLAEAQGDSADAEAFYRELAILNPRHAEARRALAEIALHRGDFGAAAVRLEEVLRLLPAGATEHLLEARQRLGAVYVQLGDWGSARYYLELVLTQDPSRQAALELLVEVYERLGLYREAAQACARLSRLLFEPSRRAAVLFRQGEILRAHLGDEDGAHEAYLKSSDLDPRFVPTIVRLVSYFWQEGDFSSLGDVAADLEAASFTPDDDVELAVQLALGTALAKPGRQRRWSLRGRPFDADMAARGLAQLTRKTAAAMEALDTALEVVLEWAGPAPADSALVPALADLVAHDPTDAGALRALARHAERTGAKAVARAALALLAYADPSDAEVAPRLAALAVAGAPRAEAVREGGPADHPDAAPPLRRALAALAPALVGLAGDAKTPPPATGELTPARAEALVALGRLLAAPSCVPLVVDGDVAQVSIGPSPGLPLPLVATKTAVALPDADWTFLAARALEDARGGVAVLRPLSGNDRTAILAGAQAGLLGVTDEIEGLGKEASRRVTQEPSLAAGERRERLLADLKQILSKPPEWEVFAAAAAHTANRIGLLACGSPAVALAALEREDGLAKKKGGVDEAEARRAFLRGAPVRELARYMFSPAYSRAADGQ
jgi:tetratricopeptide (TPR) repeat protein